MGILNDNKLVMELDKALKEKNITEDQLKNKPEGIGDVIESILTQIGITEDVLKRVLKRECGCSARKQFLNRLFPFFKR